MKLSLNNAALLVLGGCDSDGWFDEMDVMMAIISEKKKEEAKQVHSHVRKLFYRQLHGGDKKKRMRYIVHPSLVPIKYSPWRKLFYSVDECVLITVTSLNYRPFYILHD
eukprot:2420708-Ditylum_brightwellii.AAC.1